MIQQPKYITNKLCCVTEFVFPKIGLLFPKHCGLKFWPLVWKCKPFFFFECWIQHTCHVIVKEPDTAEPLPDIDESVEVSEEQMDQSNDKKREAIGAYNEQEYGKAADLYTEAIKLNPGSFNFTSVKYHKLRTLPVQSICEN